MGCVSDTRVHALLLLLHPPVFYFPEKSEKDPEALFQQRIPKDYLTLQEHIRGKLKELKEEEKAPVLTEKEFR